MMILDGSSGGLGGTLILKEKISLAPIRQVEWGR